MVCLVFPWNLKMWFLCGEREEESRRRKFSIIFIITRNSEETGIKRKHLQLTQFMISSSTWSFHLSHCCVLSYPATSSPQLLYLSLLQVVCSSCARLLAGRLGRQLIAVWTYLHNCNGGVGCSKTYARSYLLSCWHLQTIFSADG